jgi:hypothetical protein
MPGIVEKEADNPLLFIEFPLVNIPSFISEIEYIPITNNSQVSGEVIEQVFFKQILITKENWVEFGEFLYIGEQNDELSHSYAPFFIPRENRRNPLWIKRSPHGDLILSAVYNAADDAINLHVNNYATCIFTIDENTSGYWNEHEDDYQNSFFWLDNERISLFDNHRVYNAKTHQSEQIVLPYVLLDTKEYDLPEVIENDGSLYIPGARGGEWFLGRANREGSILACVFQQAFHTEQPQVDICLYDFDTKQWTGIIHVSNCRNANLFWTERGTLFYGAAIDKSFCAFEYDPLNGSNQMLYIIEDLSGSIDVVSQYFWVDNKVIDPTDGKIIRVLEDRKPFSYSLINNRFIGVIGNNNQDVIIDDFEKELRYRVDVASFVGNDIPSNIYFWNRDEGISVEFI